MMSSERSSEVEQLETNDGVRSAVQRHGIEQTCTKPQSMGAIAKSPTEWDFETGGGGGGKKVRLW